MVHRYVPVHEPFLPLCFLREDADLTQQVDRQNKARFWIESRACRRPCFCVVALMSTPLAVPEFKYVPILHYGRGHSCEICRNIPVQRPIAAVL